MRSARFAALLMLSLSLPGLLAGCAARGALIDPAARGAELVDTPFFAQERFQCGPAALATVLGASGVPVLPEELESQVYIPARKGSLTIEMQAAPRRYGRISYLLQPELQAIIEEIDAGRPVIVLHNYGLPFWPRWHYAVVIGYDALRQHVLLRSGTTRRLQLSAASFMRAWDNADRWALVLLAPGELPARVERATYLEAASAFERTASAPDARLAFEAAINAWPEEPVAWVGRGTAHYRVGHFDLAARDYSRALALDPALIGARNNLAMALLERGCRTEARRELGMIDATSLPERLRAAVTDTARQIETRAAGRVPDDCATHPVQQ